MIEIDFEDFVEEVKFQMTEYEELDETTILDWETKLRKWVKEHKEKKFFHVKSKDDIAVFLRDEDEMYELAEKFYRAYKNNKLDEYWKKLKWGR
ncbi:hypothetical protein EDD66_11461 [Mobilisporobacter senegalensis]|uniref:Uncharacterized protein n=1 Tax=Mobilisporobacter senegalensis TaxID=1329262 RepID=A0A3N1X9L5_9FIRM|nr:hypothetical protein [Mobilisporobacter senegalensis]ROR23454.1 hypothetical protein EDD66_11461 [Mobilisporobacter senegalensis]